MSGSTLTGFTYIPDPSQGTPGLWNAIFSVLSQNIAEANSVGGIVSNVSTVGVVTINANSNVTNYLALDDSSGARSNYIIGSQVGGTADGLNIYDASGATLIVSFSKQSVRFFQNVVGPVFDVGGALASTYNAGTFGTGTDSKESRIQAAINQASLDNVARVYVPANMYPYSASSVSFITTVQMVREGGNWTAYDIQAYGASNSSTIDSSAAIIGAAAAASAAGGGVVFYGPGFWTGQYLPISTGVHHIGSGRFVTNLGLGQSSNTDLFIGDGFWSLTSGTSNGGVYGWSIRDMTLKGHRTGVGGSNTTGWGARLYGFDYTIADVTFRDFAAGGFYSEWSGAASPIGGLQTEEAAIRGLRCVNNLGNGVTFQGPHDTVLTQCFAVVNTGTGMYFGTNGAANLIGCHVWGATHIHDFQFDSTCQASGCFADGQGNGDGFRINASDCVLSGCFAFSLTSGAAYHILAGGGSAAIQGDASTCSCGLQIDAGSANNQVSLRVNAPTGAAIYFNGTDTGQQHITANINKASGAAITGTPAVTDYLCLNVQGGATSTYGGILMPRGGPFIQQAIGLTDGATVNVSLQSANYLTLAAGASRTIANPTNIGNWQTFTIELLNNTAGAITTTWSSNYQLAGGVWVDPAATKKRLITFVWNATSGKAVEQYRSSADL